MRKPAFCICESKGADLLSSNCAADQRVWFCYIDSTISLLPKFQISSNPLWPYSSVYVGFGPKTPKTGFLVTQLMFDLSISKKL